MKQDVAVNEILKQWEAQWPAQSLAAIGSSVTSCYGDEPFTEPDPPAYWAHVEIAHAPTLQYTMGAPGNKKVQCPGTITVTLYGPAGGGGGTKDGRSPLDVLATVVATVYSVQRLAETPGDDGVILRTATPKELGTDGRWQMLAMLVPFEYTDVR